jgi:2-dehydro-3-deoxy-D-gluconate 5-dehydrogenase
LLFVKLDVGIYKGADRWAKLFDLMGAVVFLGSRASDYVNGHILAVDGGWLVR